MAVNRDGTALALRARARRALRPAVVAGGPRAAAFALCRQQARGRGSRGRPLRTLARGAGAGRLRAGRSRDAGLFPRRGAGVCAPAEAARCPAVPDPRRGPGRGPGAGRRAAAARLGLRNRRRPGRAATAMATCKPPPRRPWAGRPGRSPIPRIAMDGRRPGERASARRWAGPVQILTPGKVNEIFHSDWTVHDRRLAAAIGFAARYDLASGLRRHDLVVSPARLALERVKHCVTNCYFTKNRSFCHICRCPTPGTGETLLRTAHQLTVENDGIVDTVTLARGILRADVIREICRPSGTLPGRREAHHRRDRDRQGPDHRFARDHGHGHGTRRSVRRLDSR